jgi:hypothetical protein
LFIVFLLDPITKKTISKGRLDSLVLDLANIKELCENMEEIGIKLGSRKQAYIT